VSADPLSPERGSYQFAQQMLQQVAYDTLSRRDRKARHLAVASHLRTAFPGDGEEVADVIARHYLDALHAIPDDPDTAEIRDHAAEALIRAAERAKRTGAPALAATSYATAAQLTEENGQDDGRTAGQLWELAAESALASASHGAAIEHAGRARDWHLQRGQPRAAARMQVIAGRALRMWGRHADAREQVTAALDVLQADPDADTVLAMEQLGTLEVFAGGPDADRLTTQALVLGQALDVGTDQLIDLFTSRGICLFTMGRRPEGIAYIGEATRLATQVGDNMRVGANLLNLSEALAVTDPAAAVEAARSATGHLRRAGERGFLAYATGNLIQALLLLGEWHAAEQEFTQAQDSDGLGDIEIIMAYHGWLAALRGDTGTAEDALAALRDLRASDDAQDQAMIAIVEALNATARLEPETALRHARSVLAHADALGISQESLRWAWPLAARAAWDLGDTAATSELLALLDSYPPGHLARMQRAERDLVRARLADHDGDQAAAASYAAAISGLRQLSTPYHLAHGLLDYAQHLRRAGDAAAAAAAIDEARAIARQLGCQPLLNRADALAPAKTQARV
jgi:hypothetical protein